ncbi:MAG: protocatechuate 3,4-dioxygenase, beta subunit [Mycobacterium sp.]|nr:protocatechuate 3,4-dioxygenase, beta subunit [Mycobacterium sp.]
MQQAGGLVNTAGRSKIARQPGAPALCRTPRHSNKQEIRRRRSRAADSGVSVSFDEGCSTVGPRCVPTWDNGEIARIAAAYQGRGEVQPRLDYPPYRSSLLRHPRSPFVCVDPDEVECWAPCFGNHEVEPRDADLTAGHPGEPIGERIIVTGRLLDATGKPVAGQLVEIWQANAAGRYNHELDQHPAPIDPNFTGAGRCLTGPDGTYRFLTIKPGPYPWRNHQNAWRPAHIHFSVFGTAFTQRLVTQMYFPGDPLFGLDPIYQSIVDPVARQRLICSYDHDLTEPEYATGYRWDIVVAGGPRTWTEERGGHD